MPNGSADPNDDARTGLIASAQDTAGTGSDTDAIKQQKLLASLQQQNETLKADNSKLAAIVEIEKAKAALIGPYASKVFWFLVGYCICVYIILLLQGFKPKGFSLDTPVTSIISGSTAVAAIGLVGIVVRGLFGATTKEKPATSEKEK